MLVRELLATDQSSYDAQIDHPLQTWAWGEARKATGHQVIRLGVFDNQDLVRAWMMTIHSIPKFGRNLLYFPRGPLPDQQITQAIITEGQKHSAVFAKLEPNVYVPMTENQDPQSQLRDLEQQLTQLGYLPGKPLFTPYNFIINLAQSQDQLLANMKPKTRYNVRLAEKKGVTVIEDNSDQAFNTYLELMAETTSRQKFYAHDAGYHRQVWTHMHSAGIAHLLTAQYQNQTLAAWILFIWKNKLYYPYGASSREHKQVMANNLMMWQAIKFGQQHQCHTFDLWGTAGLDPQPTDPWYGFHRFKLGYGPQTVKYLGAYDLPVDTKLYPLVNKLYGLRKWFLRLKSTFTSTNFS